MSIKVCVIGAGRWGQNHVKTLHQLGVLGGVIESSDSKLAELRSLYPDTPLFKSVHDDGALAFDAYTVAVPAQFHYSVAKTLLEKNKHVLVEKPITLTSEEGEELNDLARKNNLVLMVGHLLLFHPAFIKMKSLINDGKLGKIQYIYSNRLNLGTVRTEENSLWSFAPHDISLFQYFINDFPSKITADGGRFIQPHIHDTTMMMLHYPNNIVGHIFVSWLHPFKEHRFVVIGTKGMIMYEDSSPNKELFFYEKGIDWTEGEPVKRDGPTRKIDYDKTPPLEAEMTHFIECIAGKNSNSKISGEKGLEVLKILEKAEESMAPSESSSSQPKQEKPACTVHPTAVVDDNVTLGEGTKIWHFSHVQSNSTIGKYCILGQNVNVGCNVIIGNHCKIQNNVSIYEGVELEDYVFCGPSMVFTNIKVPRCKYPQAASKFYVKTLLKEGTSIGANATIVCGTTLGRYSFVGAGAVVTKDVPDFAIVQGNPAKVVGWMSEGGTKLEFNEEGKAFCKKSNQWYLKEGNLVKELERVPNYVHQ